VKPLLRFFAVKKVDAQQQLTTSTPPFQSYGCSDECLKYWLLCQRTGAGTLAGDDTDNTNSLEAVEASIQIDFFMCHGADNHALLLSVPHKCSICPCNGLEKGQKPENGGLSFEVSATDQSKYLSFCNAKVSSSLAFLSHIQFS
jgi:hypothetical protein